MIKTEERQLPPHDSDAEESVIGSLLIEGERFAEIQNLLQTSDFYYDQHQWLFAACCSVYDRKESINQITLAQELSRQGKLDKVGGAAQLSHLIAVCPSPLDIVHYAQIVRRLSIARGISELGQKISTIGLEARPDTNQALDEITTLTQQFRTTNTTGAGIINAKMAAQQMLDLIGKYGQPQHSLSFGYRDMDMLSTGIYPSEFIIIGGRPSVGKTQFMLDIAEQVADTGAHVLFVSAEMSMDMILERKLSRELGTSVRSMRKYALSDSQTDVAVEIAGKMAERNINYLPQGVTSQDVYDKAKMLKEAGNLSIVFVDYLGILKDAYMGMGENANAKVGKVCKVLKSITNDLGVPVVCACQLSRSVEYRDDKRPMLSDLRDSGNIEQDADVVFLLYRDPEFPDILEVDMAKHRQLGAAGNPAKLLWHKSKNRYVDLAEDNNGRYGA